MTFFPFGIPSTSSFAENAQHSQNLNAPNYVAPYALVAQNAPSGSAGINATTSSCPPGYSLAVDLPPNPLATGRDTYILCYETP